MDSIIQNILVVTTTAEFWGVLASVGFIVWFIWKFIVQKYNIPKQVDEIVEDRIEEFTDYARAKHAEIKAKTEQLEKEKEIDLATQNKIITEIKETSEEEKKQDIFIGYDEEEKPVYKKVRKRKNETE